MVFAFSIIIVSTSKCRARCDVVTGILFFTVFCIKTIKTHRGQFFRMTMSFTGIGLFIFNDYLRVYGTYEKTTWVEKLFLYAIYLTLSLFRLYKISQHKKSR